MKKITKPVIANQLGLEELTDAQMEVQTGGSKQAFIDAFQKNDQTMNGIATKVQTTGIDPKTITADTFNTWYTDFSNNTLSNQEFSLLQKVSSVLSASQKTYLLGLYKKP